MKTMTLDSLDSFSVDFDTSPHRDWFEEKEGQGTLLAQVFLTCALVIIKKGTSDAAA